MTLLVPMMAKMDTSMIVRMDTCITLIGRPVSFARVSRMCLVGFGVCKQLYIALLALINRRLEGLLAICINRVSPGQRLT